MLTRGNYFPEQKRDEEVVRFIRRHWMSFVWPWGIILIVLLLICITIAATFYFNYSDQILSNSDVNASVFIVSARDLFIITSTSTILVIIALALNVWINYYLDVTILTTDHLVDIRLEGLFNRKVSEQTLLRVQDVSSRMKGILQTFFHYGAVFVETAGEAPNFEMQNIPKPHKLANEIMRLHEELVERGEFHKSLAEADGIVKLSKSKENSPQKITPIKEIKTISEHSDSRIDINSKKTSLNTRLLNYLKTNPKVKPNINKEDIQIKENSNEEGNLEEGKVIKL